MARVSLTLTLTARLFHTGGTAHLLMHSQWRGGRQRGGAALGQVVRPEGAARETSASVLVGCTCARVETVGIDENCLSFDAKGEHLRNIGRKKYYCGQ